jgi:predicted nucleic acid-binding protein
MSFVIDASVVLAILLPDEKQSQGDLVLEQMIRSGAQAPNLLLLEVNNALGMAVKRKRISRSEAEKLAGFFEQFRIDFDFTNAARFTEIKRIMASYGMTSYDACYLELAQRHKLPLASFDQGMVRGAQDMGVSISGLVL